MKNKVKTGLILGIALVVSIAAIFAIFPLSPVSTSGGVANGNTGTNTPGSGKNITINLNENVELKDQQ